MTIRGLQLQIQEVLNNFEELLQGGCKAFIEDVRTVYDEAKQHIDEGGVALVVVTPDFTRAGSGVGEEGLPFEGDVLVRCMERPPISAAQGDVIRALDAAEIVSHILDGEVLEWTSIRQTHDRRENIFTATATFTLAGMLTREPPNHQTT